MTKKDLIISLVRQRLHNSALAAGATQGEAAILAEQRLSNEGMFGMLSSVKAAGLPEGGIASIVETYWTRVLAQIRGNPVMSELSQGSELRTALIAHFGRQAIKQIQNFRNSTYRLDGDPPQELVAFVSYRLNGEMRQLHNMRPADMGLSGEIIATNVQACSEFFQRELTRR